LYLYLTHYAPYLGVRHNLKTLKMKKIKPYNDINEAISSLDNGGRFYNILTKADDGIINQSELGKVGGIFNDKQKMILFLELSISNLNETKKGEIISKLEDDLKTIYKKYKPQELLPSEANSKGILSSNAILTGIPKLTESKSDFKGFIMIPIMTGNVTTFTMIPIIEKYDVYELRDDESTETFLIAHSKGSEKLPSEKIKIAGVLKELKSNKEEKNASKKFLEAVYHIEIN
jgi:hypothetical protein